MCSINITTNIFHIIHFLGLLRVYNKIYIKNLLITLKKKKNRKKFRRTLNTRDFWVLHKISKSQFEMHESYG